MKVIGAVIQSGNYQGFDYKNVVLHGTYQLKNGVGVGTAKEKIKHDRLCDILGKHVDNTVLTKDVVGKSFDFGYDKFQNVTHMEEVKEGAS